MSDHVCIYVCMYSPDAPSQPQYVQMVRYMGNKCHDVAKICEKQISNQKLCENKTEESIQQHTRSNARTPAIIHESMQAV